MLGAAQWGTHHRDQSDNLIGHPASEMRNVTRLCIGPWSKRFNDLLFHLEKVELVANEPLVAHYLLALRRIEEVDRDTNFRLFKRRFSVAGCRIIYRRVLLVTLLS